VPGEEAQACLEALRDCGYGQAAIIGRVHAQGERLEPVTVLL
jgi:hydrogenase maturation factor